MFVREAIDVEIVAQFKHIIRIPGRVDLRGKAGSKGYAALEAVERDDGDDTFSANELAFDAIQAVRGLWCSGQFREPLDVCEMCWCVGVVLEDACARVLCETEYQAHLSHSITCKYNGAVSKGAHKDVELQEAR